MGTREPVLYSRMSRRGLLMLATSAVISLRASHAQTKGAVRIGVMNDMSSVYADFQGPGSVVAAQLATEDFARFSSRGAEVISADHQNKADVGSAGAARGLWSRPPPG